MQNLNEMRRLLEMYGSEEVIEPYTRLEGKVREVLKEIYEKNSNLCCTLDVPFTDFSFWFRFIRWSQETHSDNIKFDELGQENKEHRQFELAKSVANIDIFNELLADVTLSMRDEPGLASYTLRLRWLETSFLKAELDFYAFVTEYDGEKEEFNTAKKYIAMIHSQVDPDILNCVHEVYIINKIQEGGQMKIPEAILEFTPETFVEWLIQRRDDSGL